MKVLIPEIKNEQLIIGYGLLILENEKQQGINA